MQSPWVGIDTVSDNNSWACALHKSQVGSQVRVGDAVQGRQQGRAPAQGHCEGRVRWNPLLPAGGASGEEGLIHLCFL